MYAVVKENRSANKFFIKTRRVPQISNNKLDSFDNSIKKDADTLQANYSNMLVRNFMKKNQKQISSQHEEMVRYMSSSWNGVKEQLELEQQQQQQQQTLASTNEISDDLAASSVAANSSVNAKKTNQIHYLSSCSTPKNFVPFDLESFWREKILQNIMGSA